jgi:hypothetical protein
MGAPAWRDERALRLKNALIQTTANGAERIVCELLLALWDVGYIFEVTPFASQADFQAAVINAAYW